MFWKRHSGWRLKLFAVALSLNAFSQTIASPFSIEVDLTTHLGDQQHFVKGDELSFYLTSNKAGYLYLFYQDANQQLYQLLPNSKERNNYYETALFVALPNQRQPFKFIVQEPYGKELVIAYLSDNGDIQLEGEISENGFSRLETGISELNLLIKQQSKQAFGKDELLVQTSAK